MLKDRNRAQRILKILQRQQHRYKRSFYFAIFKEKTTGCCFWKMTLFCKHTESRFRGRGVHGIFIFEEVAKKITVPPSLNDPYLELIFDW